MYSTVEDLLDFAHAHLFTVDDEKLNRALEDTLKVRLDDAEPRRALAWAVDEINGKEIFFQIGYVSGYSAYIGMDPARKTAVVVLQNTLYWTERVGHRLLLLMGKAASHCDK